MRRIAEIFLVIVIPAIIAACFLSCGIGEVGKYPPNQYKGLKYRFLTWGTMGNFENKHIELSYYLKKIDLDNEQNRKKLNDLVLCLVDNARQVNIDPRFDPDAVKRKLNSVYDFDGLAIFFYEKNYNSGKYIHTTSYVNFFFKVQPDSTFIQQKIVLANGELNWGRNSFELDYGDIPDDCKDVVGYSWD
jgi:hypothetical protein